MFQPQAKLEFVRRYCSPVDGWAVYVDIDPSEEGRTGGQRTTQEARRRQRDMKEAARKVRGEMQRLGVTVGGSRTTWAHEHGFPSIAGDRDMIAFNAKRRLCLVAEVEGESSGQPEQKLYKAIGQIVVAAGEDTPEGWERILVLVVSGDSLRDQLARAKALSRIGVSAIALNDDREHDSLLFGFGLPGTSCDR